MIHSPVPFLPQPAARPAAAEPATAPADARIEASLAASRREGIAAQISGTLVDHYLVPFAVFLGAPAASIGAVVAVPHLAGAAAPLFAVRAVRRVGDRRRLLILGALLQGLALLPLALLPALHLAARIQLLVLFVALYRVAGGLMGPAWGSLMSEYLPPERRGDYFGRRSQLIGLFGMLATALAGLMLDSVSAAASSAAAFGLLFLVPAAARLYSCRPMAQMCPMPEPAETAEAWTGPGFAARLRESKTVRLVAFVASLTFATHLSSTYFSVHMLKDLGFGYAEYMAVHLASSLAAFALFPLWGRAADRSGNVRVLRLTGLLVPAIPLLWAAFESPAALFAVELFSGFAWSGFNLCATNYLYEAVPPAKRVRALSYANVLYGVAMFSGAALGGWISARLPAIGGHPLHALFLASAAARLGLYLAFSRGIREVRADAESLSSAELFFTVVGLRTLAGRNADWASRAPSR